MHSGLSMTFVRLAGCNVGKPYTKAAKETLGLNVYQERCTSALGENFACDTDYRVKQRMSVAEIVDAVSKAGIGTVCLTGGEPYLHDIGPLIKTLMDEGFAVHIETSGTKSIDVMPTWLTVSPKAGILIGALAQADEVKILAGPEVNKTVLASLLANIPMKTPVYLSPINFENKLDMDNMQRALMLQKEYPRLRLMAQLHKLWMVR